MSYTPKPENMRVPNHLSDAELQQALEELDSKIKTLQNRAHATTANSHHTYHEHVAALEVKRAKLTEMLSRDTDSTKREPSTWDEIRRGIDTLRDDLRNLI
ncbi:sll1863 family stress response protein [Hymenobacter radiodurans]|uniref:hypothetical protein n=1 Tax=Hymenobacter radiodurans TaxID=2496028 RepID=UPI001058B92B|nr:hypothetical protein [Hymenobacter radiodurans]